MTTQTYTIEHETNDGINLTINFEADFEKEDHGIGGYEYWGSRGNDVYIVYVCSGIGIESAINEDGANVLNILDKETIKSIESACEEYANENAPDADSDDGDYDDSDRPSHYDND